jgi:superoxide dismutase, Fe-Mn family
MPHAIRPLPFKPGSFPGLSERILTSHYENNYGGAVRRLQAIERRVAALDPANAAGFDWNGLKREELIAYNSMVLHEVYFDGLGAPVDPPADLRRAIDADFASFDAWHNQFAAMGRALAGGSGWVVLALGRRDGRLRNQWAADHTGVLADSAPILALDMYEHSYHMDFGANAGAYVDVYFKCLDWRRPAERWRAAMGAAPQPAADPTALPPEELLAAPPSDRPLVIDVRRRPAFAAAPDMIAGAEWRDPEQVEVWANELPKDREIVAYCVYGFEVGSNAAKALRARGLKARHMAGGIAAWHALAGPLAKKEPAR